MTVQKQIWKCNVCGNIVEVVHEAGGVLVCCGQPMKLLEENTVDASKEKHVPVIEQTKNGIKVKVGSVVHPMISEHYIEWIEILADRKSYKIFLQPGQKPEAEFCITEKNKNIIAREYCNLHGLWKSS